MQVERIDDIPLICSELNKLQIAEIMNRHFPVHGNWQGASIGTLCCVFLSYILSESDHRLSHVEDWYVSLQHVLGHCLVSPELDRLDCTDDRLGQLLDYMSDDDKYVGFEKELNEHIITVYSLVGDSLADKTIHLDATIAQSFKDPSDLFSIGYAKQRRHDLTQLKVMLGTLGVLGLPLCVDVVNGSMSDDVLYLPMVERVEKTLEMKGLLFVGDSKLGSIGNRHVIAHKGHYYLTPLNRVQMPFNELANLLKSVTTTNCLIDMGENVTIKAFEHELTRQHANDSWTERLVSVFSPTYAKAQITQFDKQIQQNKQALEALTVIKQGKTPFKEEHELQHKINEILHKSKTSAFFDVHIQTTTTETTVRKYGDRPEQKRLKHTFELTIKLNETAINAHKDVLGWRVFATNAPKDALSTQKVIETYKEEIKVEYRFNQLHNKTAALMPIYLQKDERIKALIRILMIALKVIAIIQYKAREALKNTQAQVNELFPGNPGRKTNQPTAEMILRAFSNISIVFIALNDKNTHIEVSKLSNSQKHLLNLLGISPLIYEDLPAFLKSKFKINET